MLCDREPGEGLWWEEAPLSSSTFTFDFQLSWKHDSLLRFFFFLNAWTPGQVLSWDKSDLLSCSLGRYEDAQWFRIWPMLFLFPSKNQTTAFMCSIITYVNIFQKHNFPVTQSAFK